MTIIGLTSADLRNARQYIRVIDSLGAEVRLLVPAEEGSIPSEQLMNGVGGLLLTGGLDVDPSHYGATPEFGAGLNGCPPLDDLEFRLLDYALNQDMPVLAICRGMQVLNVAFGGELIQDLPGHRAVQIDGKWESSTHQIYLSPGSKAAAIIGSAGFFKVNSRHHQGLREAQRAPRLMTTGYSVEDGLVEALESPEHSWVIGIQCHPERQDEVPRSFAKLFEAFLDRAESFRTLTQV